MESPVRFDQQSFPQPVEFEGFLYAKQYTHFKDVEEGFMHECHDDGSPRWTSLYPFAAKDHGDDIWMFHCDTERVGEPEGWQVRKWSMNDEFEWVSLAYVIETTIKCRDGSSFMTAQLALRDSTNNDIINVLFKSDNVRVNHWSSVETMRPLPVPVTREVGPYAVASTVDIAAA